MPSAKKSRKSTTVSRMRRVATKTPKRAADHGAARRREDQEAQARRQVREYLEAQPAEARGMLRRMRDLIRAVAPAATEAFSYRIPGFRLEGRPLVWYAGFTRHVSLFPIGDAIRRAHARELQGYETSKGTVRFPLGKPLPDALVERLVKARIAESRRPARGTERREVATRRKASSRGSR